MIAHTIAAILLLWALIGVILAANWLTSRDWAAFRLACWCMAMAAPAVAAHLAEAGARRAGRSLRRRLRSLRRKNAQPPRHGQPVTRPRPTPQHRPRPAGF